MPNTEIGTRCRYLGRLDEVLDSFDHAGFHRQHAWDVRNTLMLRSFYQYLDEPWRQEMVQSVRCTRAAAP
jgi:Ser/Thr protein kinase RdoA (MazF antagonist)